MLTVTDWSQDKASAILTQEPSLIRFTHKYYENPNCCSNMI